MSYKNIIIIYNPHAGRTHPFERKVIARELEKYPGYKEWLTVSDDLNLKNVEWKKFDLVLVAGGDGTIREVAQVLMDMTINLPLGLIPTGSANILAISLGVPWNIKRAVKFAFTEKPHTIDAGIVNEKHLFLIGVSMGMDAKVIGLTPRHWKKVYGLLAYLMSAFRVFFSSEEYHFSLQVDEHGVTHRAGSIIVLNNGNFFGISIGPQISITDGKLNVVALHSVRFRKLMKIFFNVLLKRYDRIPEITYYLGEKITVTTDVKIEVEIDGEAFDLDTISVRVLPKALSVISKMS